MRLFFEASTLFPEIGYLMDFVNIGRTVRYFLRRKKLISSFLKRNIIFLSKYLDAFAEKSKEKLERH